MNYFFYFFYLNTKFFYDGVQIYSVFNPHITIRGGAREPEGVHLSKNYIIYKVKIIFWFHRSLNENYDFDIAICALTTNQNILPLFNLRESV